MTLSAGDRLGPYEVLSVLGSGGMGEVYKARHARLGRLVAIKVLPTDSSDDAERLARFEQEARAASALNHPNIIVVHDIGESELGPYIAMELVEGTTLRELLAPGPFPLKRILSIAAQAADGLASAHQAGIVHRDLKPENLMVSKDGFVKILDFGLAKLTEQSMADGSQMPTVPGGARTSAGTVLGTVGYMSPEQASGKPADFRSDQFSFGSILYEMLTGKHAFARATGAETMAAIIRDEPEPIEVHARVPEAVRWVANRCLAKEPEERYASTKDLARELTGLGGRLSRGSLVGPEGSASTRRSSFASPWAVGGLVVLAFLAGALGIGRLRQAGSGRPVTEPRALRFTLSAPPGATVPHGEIQPSLIVAPDGKHIVIRAYFEGRERLYVRSLDSTETRFLDGTEGGTSPFFSADGRSVAFFAEGKLKKIPVSGGPPVTICDAQYEGSGSWSAQGDVLFAQAAPPAGIYRVSADGGKPERVTRPEERKDGLDLWPRFLPDGRKFLYVALSYPTAGGVVTHDLRVGSLDTRQTQKLASVETLAEYSAGYLLTVREGSLLAQPFDAERSRLEGTARPIASGVHHFYGPAHAGFSVSPDVLAYQAREPDVRLAWFDRGGREMSQLSTRAPIEGLHISPDGERVALDVQDRRSGTSDIWIYDLARGTPTRVHFDATDEIRPVWFPDGQRIAYRSDRTGPPDVFTLDLGVSGSEKELFDTPAVENPVDVSADGRLLAFQRDTRKTGEDLWVVPLTGEGGPRPFLQTPFDEADLQFSSDGRWVAYVSDESGRPEVYVAPFQRPGEKIRVSTAGGRRPRWRRDGREIYWVAPGGALMAASRSDSGEQLRIGKPTALFRLETGIAEFDVAPAGEKFLVATSLSTAPQPSIEVLVNWTAALKP